MTLLHQLGCRESFNPYFKPYQNYGFNKSRVAIENRDNYLVLTDSQK